MVDGTPSPPPRVVWSVAALVQAVADALAARFATCVVQGEISGLNRAASGHAYFTLKDGDGAAASLRCAMFRRAGALLDFTPAEGQRVEVRGRLALYEPRGELQLIVESMRQAGAGALLEQFLRLKAKLEREGLFDASRKRPLPMRPVAVGVVTSADAAALRDVTASLARRAPHVRVVVYPSLVQGAAAPAQLRAALAAVAARREIDVLIICRGGGALEDLWAFNDEAVVRAIAASPVPTLCGIGHETDFTLADFAADVRAPTPTAAAELATPTRDELFEQLRTWATRARRRVATLLDTQAQRLDRAGLRLARPASAVQRQQVRLDLLATRLHAAAEQGLERRRLRLAPLAPRAQAGLHRGLEMRLHRLESLAARLDALGPQHVLARGYAWLGDAAGRPITSVKQLEVGGTIRATLADGDAGLRVESLGRRDDR
jgi:exodeoxyribonuclease VII large subunit